MLALENVRWHIDYRLFMLKAVIRVVVFNNTQRVAYLLF